MTPPRLLALDSCQVDYTVKATISGITILKQNRYKSRYTGSKAHAVDINGKLWLKAADLKKHLIDPNKVPTKKKAAVTPVTAANTTFVEYKSTDFTDNLLTHEQDFLTNLPVLSTATGVPEKKGYKIHKREVRQRLLGMIHTKAGKKELYFWTVTFPKGTPDDVAYQAFNTWLTTLRTKDKFGRRFLKNYLWVAERQDGKRLTDPGKSATNTIHFHIAIPHKMQVQHANGVMRTILKNLSIKLKIPFSTEQCKRYNGVDIAKNRNTGRVTNFAIKKGTRALTTYLTKYIAKNDARFPHLAWHNSRGFSSLITGITFTAAQFNAMYEKRIDGEGREILVKWTHFLMPTGKATRLEEVDDPLRPGQKKMEMRPYKKYFLENEYIIFQPWQYSMPRQLLNHITEVNNYIQELTAKN